jgi:hypothetical protein
MNLTYYKQKTPLTGVLMNHGREDRIRTCDPLLPKQMRYQTALLPDLPGAPDMSRTRNLQIRSLTLYPIELRAQSIFFRHKLQPFGGSYRNRTDGH